MYGKWLSAGEARHSERVGEVVPRTALSDHRDRPWSFEARLVDLARSLGLNLIVRLPRTRLRDPGPVQGKTLRQVLDEMSTLHGFMSKWHDGALVLSTKKWHLMEEQVARTSWELTKPLVDAEGPRRTKALTVEALSEVASRLTTAQVRGLTNDWNAFSHVARYHPFFGLCGSSPLVRRAMLSSAGHPVTEGQALAFLQIPQARQLIEMHGVRAVRILESDGKPPLPSGSTSVDVQLQGTDGEWRYVGSFYHSARLRDAAENSRKPSKQAALSPA